MPRGRRKTAEQTMEDFVMPVVESEPEPIPEPEPEPVPEPAMPNIYKFESEHPVFKPVEDTNLEGIAHTPRFSVSRQIPDMKYHSKCSDQIYSITRNGVELYFKLPTLSFETVMNLWAAARNNISVEDFLIELQTINGVRPIIFHVDLKTIF